MNCEKTTQQELPPRPVQKRLLIPLAAVFVVLLVGFAVAFNTLQQYNLNYSSVEELEAALNGFSIALAEQTDLLAALTTVLARDEKLRQGLRTLDRDYLYTNYQPLFTQLRKKFKITHLYFQRSDRHNLLRVHKPDKHGDLIKRFTTLEAERTRKIATGVELGPLGTFTLRVVAPILENNQLLGYIELGKEIEDILVPIHSRDEVECIVAIDKKFLNQQAWQQGMIMLGRNADWFRHASEVIAYNSIPTCADLCDRLVEADYSDHVFNETSSDGKHWNVFVRPLTDASATVVGKFILLHDNSLRNAFFARLVTIAVLVALFVLAALFTYLLNILRKTDSSISSQQHRLVRQKGEIQKYVKAIDDMGLGLLVVNSDFQILEYNGTMKSWFGDDQGIPCYQQIFETATPCNGCHLDEVLTGGKTLHFEAQTASGQFFDIISTPLLNTDGTISMMEIFKDITELKRGEIKRLKLEEQLRQKHKMEAVGLMAGGMAHNFNNNLAVILGNIELAQLRQHKGNGFVTLLENAKTAALRARDLIQNILTYSREGTHDTHLIQLSLVINESINLLRSTIPATINIELIISHDGKAATINADPSQIQEALFNLCNNAVHAMDESGVLKVQLDTVDLQAQDIPIQYDCLPGRYVRLSVQDSGSGMSAETVEKIFDPFFTTKEVGQGTGMGLSTVQGIIKTHNGMIKVTSTLGDGTIFDLYFPVVEQSQAVEKELEDTSLPEGTERILLVDDDENLAKLGEEVLTEAGYQVTTLTSSTKAMKVFTTNHDHFDLVITDQTMPELSGKDLIQSIKKIRSATPTILCTGHSNMVDVETAAALGIDAFLTKPVQIPELLQTVRRVLDAVKAGF